MKRRRRSPQKDVHTRFKSNRDMLPHLEPHVAYERYEPSSREEETIWPRRLLHIPTMTSFVRSAKNIYGECKEPAYNALSYTWGRYSDPKGASIPVKNVTWTVPPISESHFSRNEFVNAIQAAGVGVSYVWVDVACIDQEDNTVKIDEIGKQAAIFRRAARVFAWLVPWTLEALEDCLSPIEHYYSRQPLDASKDDIKGSTLDSAYFSRTSKCMNSLDTITSILDAVQDLRHQPWFTSLWTLQEAYLRKDAIILSRSSAGPSLVHRMDADFRMPLTINWLLVRCQQIYTMCRLESTPSSMAVCQTLMDSGLLALSAVNEWSLYSASTKRQASLHEDRVYGIMQVYNIRLGAQSDFSRLEDSLGFHLNDKDPVLSQLHVHEQPPGEGKAWRVSRHMTIPFVYVGALTSGIKCTISASPRKIPLYDGKVCDFDALVDEWHKNWLHRKNAGLSLFEAHVALDAQSHPPRTADIFSLHEDNLLPDSSVLTLPNSERVRFTHLQSHFPRLLTDYKVLMMGWISCGDLEPGPRWVGLVVNQRTQSIGKPWIRVGVCSWPGMITGRNDLMSLHGRPDDLSEGLWKTVTGRLG